MTKLNLINWPSPGFIGGSEPVYRDTGEGGLFAYATWSLENVKQDCFIDVTPSMNFGDVRVASVGPDEKLFRWQTKNYEELSNSNRPFDEQIEKMISNTVPAMGAVFLGSTSFSLFDDKVGEFFIVTEDALTEEGLAIVKALETVYGSKATYSTYLDT